MQEQINKLTKENAQLRAELEAIGAGGVDSLRKPQCLHQIQEPAPVQSAPAIDALREAEAALEVAIARILKADPGHSISVTSEAKALATVRSALAAQADHIADAGNMVVATPATAAPVVLPEPAAYIGTWRPNGLLVDHSVCGFTVEELKNSSPSSRFEPLYTEQQVRALLATGGHPHARGHRTP